MSRNLIFLEHPEKRRHIVFLIFKMKNYEHCNRTIEIFGQDYSEIYRYMDRNFDWITLERLFCLTDGDWYPDMQTIDLFKHRELEHHKEGIELIVEHFKDKYPEDIVRGVVELHITEDYKGYLPSKEDFQNPDFIKKYHR